MLCKQAVFSSLSRVLSHVMHNSSVLFKISLIITSNKEIKFFCWFVCLITEKKPWPDLHEIWWNGVGWAKEELNAFYNDLYHYPHSWVPVIS